MSGPQNSEPAVQDKHTELHMTAHKEMGAQKNPNQAVPNKEIETTMSGPPKSEPGSAR